MKKWISSLLIFLFIILLAWVFGLSHDSGKSIDSNKEGRVVLTQYLDEAGKKVEKDTYLTQMLRQLKEKVDGWLKSLNERIEREDVTRFEVRFLEILRSLLEWVKGMIDSYLEPSEEDTPGEKVMTRREIHLKGASFPRTG